MCVLLYFTVLYIFELPYDVKTVYDKMRSGRICGVDLNGDNLRISRAYLRISDHCRVRVRLGLGLGLGQG